MLTVRNAFKTHFLLLISHNSVLHPIAATCSPPFATACRDHFIFFIQKVTASVSRLCQPAITHSSGPLLFTSFVCATFMTQSVTHILFPHEGNTGKLCCTSFCIIKTMTGNGTVPSWCKHGTIQPSQLNRPLLFPTTYWINVKKGFRIHFLIDAAACPGCYYIVFFTHC